jgi:mycothiol synthase
LMEARSRTDDWRYAHIGDLMWAFFVLASHFNPQEHVRLWHNGQGKLIGYAFLAEDPPFDCQVLPEYEGSGIEAEALAWAETCLTELRKVDAERWSDDLVSGVRQDNSRRIAFLEQHGFQRGEHVEVNLLRSLDEPIPEPTLSTSYQVRAVATTGETSERAAAEREVWQPWPTSKIDGGDYARLMRLPGYHRDLDVVAVTSDGIIAAYVNGWVDPVNRIGDFGPVGTRPAYRRQGLMRAVLLEGLRRLKAHGMDRVCVSTGVSNIPAIRLYESIGFEIVNQYLDYVKTE